MLYKIISPSSKDTIVSELAAKFPQYFKDINETENNFYGGKTQLIKFLCPALTLFLSEHKLLDRWTDTGVSVIRHDYHMPIHTDSNKPDRQYALNIPVVNCVESYMVWYDPIDPTQVEHREYMAGTATVVAQYYKKDNVVEIDRAPSDCMMFVNVRVPHNGINLNNNVRSIISLRFTPELTVEEIEHLEKTINNN